MDTIYFVYTKPRDGGIETISASYSEKEHVNARDRAMLTKAQSMGAGLLARVVAHTDREWLDLIPLALPMTKVLGKVG